MASSSAATSTTPVADSAAPVATNTMGIVIGEESSRRETAVNPSKTNAMIAISAGSTPGPYNLAVNPRHKVRAVVEY